ncbi:MAG TPA: ATP-binding protein [Solirubrobacteraceae bacterium]|nr:ATP-binding protein [Solirubrobacteraceae bacterium]
MSEAPDAGESLRSFDFSSLADTGLRAVCSLWRASTRSFLRSSIDNQKAKLRPTVTFRCVEVLLSVMEQQPTLLQEHGKLVEQATAGVVNLDSRTVEKASELKYMQFTAAIWALATAKAAASKTSSAKAARERLPGRIELLRKQLPETDLPDAHPFVQEHALRAASECQRVLETDAFDDYISALRRSIAAASESLLARHYAGLITPAESVVLVFCANALSTSPGAREQRLALAALNAAATAQDASGSWPLGRVVHDEPSRLEISTYEVAWAMTETVGRLLDGAFGDTRRSTRLEDVSLILEAIWRAGTFALRSLVEIDGAHSGWASDHPYQRARIESWTSAIVLQFALAGERLRDHVRNLNALGSFNATFPTDSNWPEWLRWDKLADSGEPDSEHPVYGYLLGRVIEPIEAHPQRLPSGEQETASVLLFGPPGTSKTTIVKAVAQRLGWPIVFLSPGSFIEQGMEAIEASAKSVFSRLLELRRVVVIFDECDELFRDRNPAGATEQVRNISAFVTASMLPKLQDLHDRGKVLFFICTNHVAMMDQAVLRGGRMDHRIGVGPPDEDGRRSIVVDLCAKLVPCEHLDVALEALVLGSERFSRSELQRATRRLAATAPWADADAAIKSARAVVHDMDEALTISRKAMHVYVEQQRRMSDPHREDIS